MRKALHLLGILNDVDVEWIADHGTLRFVSAGTVLIEEKVPVDSMYIVIEGQLKVTVQAMGERPLASLQPGEVVGEISFVDSRSPTASVVATVDSEVLALPREILSLKLSKDPAFAARFYKAVAAFLADRLRTTVGKLGYGTAQTQEAVDSFDELDNSLMDQVDIAAVRFDKLLKGLRSEFQPRVGSIAV